MKSLKKNGFCDVLASFVYSVKQAVKYFRGVLVCNAILTVCGNLIVFFSNAYMLRYIVNGVQTGKSIIALLAYTAVVIALRVIYELIHKYFINVWLPIANKRGEARLRKSLYQKAVEADLVNYEMPDSYALFDRVLSNTQVSMDQTLGLLISWISVIMSISLSSWLVFAIDPVLIVFAVIPVLLNLYYVRLIRKKHIYDSHLREIERKKSYARRAFYLKDYAKELRLSNIWRVLRRQFTDASEEYTAAVKKEGRRVALGYYIVNNLGLNIPIYAAQIYCLYHTLVTHTIYMGDCLVVLASLSAIVNPIKSVANWYATMSDISLKMSDLRAFLKRKTQIDSARGGLRAQAGDIELSDVSFTYEGSATGTLKHVSVKIRKGETVAIVGRNGAGKTTLVKLLMRLYDATSGTILLDGRDIAQYDLASYRDTIGVVMQDYKPLALSVAENVLGRPYEAEDEKTVLRALDRVGLLDKVQSTKNGIHTLLTKEFSKDGLILSGGEAQKLAIAAIYAKNCNTVILDEPSSALDPLAERQMYDTMRAACKGKTMIFISHRLSTAVDADRILLMDNGEIKESGTHSELMARGGLYAEMFTIQASQYKEGMKGETL